MGLGNFFKKVGGIFKKAGSVAPAVVTHPGFRVGLTFLGVPGVAINAIIPAVQAAQATRFRKFKKAYKLAAPILQRQFGIMKESDINYAIETALGVLEGRIKIYEEKSF
jgi:hypothetical protein